jgi:hypothetical protein
MPFRMLSSHMIHPSVFVYESILSCKERTKEGEDGEYMNRERERERKKERERDVYTAWIPPPF